MPDTELDGLPNLSPIPGTALFYLVSADTDYNGTVTDLFVGRTLSATVSFAIRSTGAAFDLGLASAEVITAKRVLSFVLGNVDRTLTVGASASVSGSNTGDQDLSGLLVKASNLSDLTNAGTARTNLGLVIGTNVQAFSARLSEVAAIGSALQQVRVNAGGTALEYFTPSGGDALTTNPLSQFAATTSTQLAGVLSDETGDGGGFVRANNPVLTTPQINDTGADHQYIFGVSELAADRTVTLPLLGGNDVFVFADFIQTLTNKTLTTPTIGSFTNATHNHTNAAGGGQITPAAFSSFAGLPVELGIAVSDEATDLTTGTAKVTFRMPYAMTVTEVRANVNTAPTGSTLIVDINDGGTTILSTLLSIDASEKTSVTAVSAAVISDSALASDSEITVDITQVGSSVPGKGLKVWLIGTRA